MLFTTFDFVLFFIVVASVYFALPHRFRWMLLLASSYFFYMCWKPAYVILIMTSTLIDYSAGRLMGPAGSKTGRKKFLVLSLVTNLGLLFCFKYFNFFNAALKDLLGVVDLPLDLPRLNVLLPVGISFYTFQSLSYAVDVYRGKREPEKHLGIYALYVSFFPQLVAGPIERSTRLLPQFFNKVSFDHERVVLGLRRVLWGFFKKMVIADRLGLVVDSVFCAPHNYSGLPLILASYCFALQIYFDFSAYSDIAIGTARVLGFDIMENFRAPYFARSIRDFWRRWHISLSSWFRDYLYIPLGGNRVKISRWRLNILVVFVLCGLWHGANWTFLAWGALHGIMLLLARATQTQRDKAYSNLGLENRLRIQNVLRVILTFHLVVLGWIIFRANSIADAGYIIAHLLDFTGASAQLPEALQSLSTWLVLPLCAFALAAFDHWLQGTANFDRFLAQRPAWVRWPVYLALILIIINLGVVDEVPFIYFQF